MADLRLTHIQSSLSLLLIFKREKREADAVLETLSIRFFSFQLQDLRYFKFKQGVHCLVPPCCFRKFEDLRFFRPKT